MQSSIKNANNDYSKRHMFINPLQSIARPREYTYATILACLKQS